MTTKPQVKIVDVMSGEEIVRDATAAEITQIKKNADNAIAVQAEAEAKETAKAALLSRLGISEDEAKLLLS